MYVNILWFISCTHKIYVSSVKYVMVFECSSKWWNVYTLCWVSENKRGVLHNGSIKNVPWCKISGFHLGIIETFALLGCYVASVLSYELFGKTYWAHLWWSSSHAWPSVVERIACPKTLVTTNQQCLTFQASKDLNTSPFMYILKSV